MVSEQEVRKARLARALKENLKRRKMQAKGKGGATQRDAGQGDSSGGSENGPKSAPKAG